MKTIMISIQPNWTEKILNFIKEWEIRKTRPKCDEPFRVLIYCTKDKNKRKTAKDFYINVKSENSLWKINDKIGLGWDFYAINCDGINWDNVFLLNGKVVGEFICDRIDEYETEFDKDDNTFQRIYHTIKGEDYNEYGEEYLINDYANDDCEDWNNVLFKNSCVSIGDLRKYLGYEDNKFYAWHISDLMIYDKPKKLSDFYSEKICKEYLEELAGCFHDDFYSTPSDSKCPYRSNEQCIDGHKNLTKPPQDWFYVKGE